MWITAKYDVAISTACAGLDYVVVDTAPTAQACVELLRTKNLGVATFLILVMRKMSECFFLEFAKKCRLNINLLTTG